MFSVWTLLRKMKAMKLSEFMEPYFYNPKLISGLLYEGPQIIMKSDGIYIYGHYIAAHANDIFIDDKRIDGIRVNMVQFYNKT